MKAKIALHFISAMLSQPLGSSLAHSFIVYSFIHHPVGFPTVQHLSSHSSSSTQDILPYSQGSPVGTDLTFFMEMMKEGRGSG